jgi:uncharacterized protein (TIGR02271 family)
MFFPMVSMYCKATELTLQFQRELLCLWAQQWSPVPAEARSRSRAEPSQASHAERWPGHGPQAPDSPRSTPAPAAQRPTETPRAMPAPVAYRRAETSGQAPVPASQRRTEDTARATEAPAIQRPRETGNGPAPAPRRGITAASPAPAPTPQVCEGTRIQLHEERLQARKQMVELGEVRVRKEVITEYQTLEVPVRREEVVIERHAPADASGAASDLRPGEEIRLPVREEQVTLEKRPVITEEVTVGKRIVQETERVGGEVRKEEVHVEREGHVTVHASETAPN